MAESRLQFLIDLEDRVTPGMQKIESSLQNFKSGLEDMKPAFTKMAAIGTAGFAAVTGAVGLSLKAYAESQVQLTRVDGILETLSSKTLKQFSGGVEQAKTIAREFGAEMQAMGGIADEAAAEGFAKFLQVTNDSSKAMEYAGVAADLAKFKNVDYGTAVLAVIKTLQGSTKELKMLGITMDENATKEEALAALAKATAGQYEKYGKTIAGQTDIMKESFGDLKENIGAAFAVPLQNLLDKIKPTIDAIIKWTGENPKLVATIAAVTAGIFGLVAVVGFLGLGLIALTGITTTLGISMLALFGWLLIIPIAIAAIIAIGVLIYKHWDDLKFLVQAMGETIVEIWNTIVDVVSNAMLAIWNAITSAWSGIQTAFETAAAFIVGVVATLLDFLFPNWEAALFAIYNSAVTIWNSIKEFFSTIFTGISEIFGGWLDSIVETWTDIWTTVKDVFNVIWESIASIFDSVVSGITKAMETLVSPIQKVINLAERALQLAGGAVKSVGGAISSGVKSIISRGSDIINGRASGGPVMGGSPYIVGEHGPEFFVPGQSGRIIPSLAMAGGGPNIFVTVTGNTLLDRDAARKMGGEFVRYLKDNRIL